MSSEIKINRVPIMVSADELKAIDDWRFANRKNSRSTAIRDLIKLGLNKTQKEITS